MRSNEYNVLKRKINRLEECVKEMKQDIKDIKMLIDSRYAAGYEYKLINSYTTIDDGSTKVNITKSSEEYNKEQTELKATLEKVKICPECGHENRCPNKYTENPDMESFDKVHGIMMPTKSTYTMKNKCTECGCEWEVESGPLPSNLVMNEPEIDESEYRSLYY